MKETPCGHKYHDECIDKLFEILRSCPLCRYKMPHENEEDEFLEVEMSFSGEDDGNFK